MATTLKTYPAPAKLNLFLHIIGQRPDGYHNLQTVFQLIDLHDELSFAPRNDTEITLSVTSKSIPGIQSIQNNDNLVVRAARLLQTTSKVSVGFNIHLEKRIPIGGGLAGGSSNAATTLLALNQLWQLNLTPPELSELALQLGADVPVFIQGKTAWAEGIGEKLVPLNLDEKWFVIIQPPCGVSTKEIFSDPQLTRDTPPIKIPQFLENKVITRNDCEPTVCRHYPIIATALNWLNQFSPARLTGTGSCIFTVCQNEELARTILQRIPKPYTGFITRGLNHSPLLGLVD